MATVSITGIDRIERDLRQLRRDAEAPARNFAGGVAKTLAVRAAAKAQKRTGRMAGAMRGKTTARKILLTNPVVYAPVQHWSGHVGRRKATYIVGTRWAYEVLKNELDEVADEVGDEIIDDMRRRGWHRG
jgi:hypothetical protein